MPSSFLLIVYLNCNLLLLFQVFCLIGINAVCVYQHQPTQCLLVSCCARVSLVPTVCRRGLQPLHCFMQWLTTRRRKNNCCVFSLPLASVIHRFHCFSSVLTFSHRYHLSADLSLLFINDYGSMKYFTSLMHFFGL